MRILDDGGYAIADHVNIPGEGTTDFIFGRGWLLEIVELTSGNYHFISNHQRVRPAGNRFGVFYPSFTFVRAYARDIKGYNFGIGSDQTIAGLPDTPFIFETDHVAEFTAIDQALYVLNSCRNSQAIAVNTDPSSLSLKTKTLIDENYQIYPSIGRLAERLHISHEHMSRQFKKDYRISPSVYLHKLRVADATLRLSIGEPIVDISMDVGYNDLSRFYKQFRKNTRTSPAVCRDILNRE
jgi:AraC-like DNA-binding protein